MPTFREYGADSSSKVLVRIVAVLRSLPSPLPLAAEEHAVCTAVWIVGDPPSRAGSWSTQPRGARERHRSRVATFHKRV